MCRGREINFGTALGQVLHHRRRVPSHTTLAVEEVKSHVEHEASRSSTTSSRTLDQANKGPVKGKLGADDDDDETEWPAGAKGFVWWGKPM